MDTITSTPDISRYTLRDENLFVDSFYVSRPGQSVSNEEILSGFGSRFTKETSVLLSNLGTDDRYLVVEDYASFISGNTSRKLLSNATALGVEAALGCLQSSSVKAGNIRVVIAVTNTSNRRLPCFGYELTSHLSWTLAISSWPDGAMGGGAGGALG